MSASEVTPAPALRRDTRPGFVRKVLGNPVAVIAIGWIVLLAVVSVFSQLTPYDPLAQDLSDSLSTPTGSHLLGTDQLGRDVLSRLMAGTGETMLGALEAIVVSILVGVPAGLIAGFVGRGADTVISRFTDMVMALPIIIVLMAVLAVFGNSLWIGMLAFGLLASAVLQRVVRAAAQAARSELYVDAARVAGVPVRVVIVRHILPVVMSSVLVQSTVLIGSAILIEAGLTFLGLGYAPPAPTWGSMIKDASDVVNDQPWLMVPPGLAIIITVVAFNVLGDALRDASPIALRGSQLAVVAAEGVGRKGGGLATVKATGGRTTPAADSVAGPGDHALHVEDLRVAFGSRDPLTVVDGVSFTIGRGEAVGLVGESGCGKTMTALALLGLLPAGGMITGGSVVFEGEDIARFSESRYARIRGSEIGFVSQEPMVALDPSFTIMSQLVEPLRAHNSISKAEARNRAIELLKLVGIPRPEAVAQNYSYEISGGMAQRVAIALALTGGPSLLVADEPTTALDVTVQAEILDVLRSLQESRGMSLLVVTHDLGVVADLCSRAVVMYAGQVVEQGPVNDLFTRPTHPYTAGLLASMPGAASGTERLEAIPGSVPSPRDWPHGCRFAGRCSYVEPRCTERPVDLRESSAGQVARCVRVEEITLGGRP